MAKILKTIFVIVATLIGAGFSSGREIYIFFFKYGKQGIFGIIISSILIGLIIYKVFKIITKNNINNYNEFLEFIFNYNYKKIKIVNIIVNLFLLILFYIMLAGASAFLKQSYNIPKYIGSIVIAIITYISLKKDIKGLEKISIILMPIIIIVISCIALKSWDKAVLQINKMEYIKDIQFPSLLSAIIYTSYNSICIVPILFQLRENINKKNIKYVSFIVSFILIILSIFIYSILLNTRVSLIEIELPIVYIVKNYGLIYEIIYSIVILVAMYTSVLSAGISFLKNESKSKKEYNRNLVIMCSTSIFICYIGFSKLISIMYPIFGIFGMLLNCYILGKKYNKNIEKKL